MTDGSDNTRKYTVLFVDDEVNILNAIRRELLRADFKVLLANSAAEAEEKLQQEIVDIVVCDVLMPEKGGIKFLEEVKEMHPDVGRVILSGYVEQAHVINAIIQGFATSYITKPWEQGELNEILQHQLEIREAFQSRHLLETINQIDCLPSLPQIYQEFIKAVAEEKSIKEISEIISRDIALTTRILQLANSVFFVGRNAISSVEEAAVRMGLTSIKDMVFAFSLINQFGWTPKQENYLDEIVKHSSRVNLCLKEVYRRKHGHALKPEMDSLGITHDIGKVLLLQYFPDRYMAAADQQLADPAMSFYDSECMLGYNGTTHGEIGAYFLDLWNLSELMVEIALNHHKPDRAGARYEELVKAIAFADELVEYLDGNNDPDDPDFSCNEDGYLDEPDFREVIGIMEQKKVNA